MKNNLKYRSWNKIKLKIKNKKNKNLKIIYKIKKLKKYHKI